MIKIKIKTFGVFKDLFADELSIEIENNSNISYVRQLIFKEIITKRNLIYLEETIKKSHFSNEEYILSEDYEIKNDETIYLLPPFSGG